MGVRPRIALLGAIALLVTGCSNGNDAGVREPTAGASQAEVVEFTTDDGITLGGLKFGTGDTAVVLAHMRGSSKEAWTEVAASLAGDGYVAMVFDFRGYAGQEGEPDTKLDVDMTAAITAIRAEGAAKVFAAGASMGGTAALAAAAQHDLEGVVAVSAPREFGGIDGMAAAAAIEEPALFIASAGDHPYVEDAAALAQAAGGRFVEYEGSAHGTDIADEQRAAITEQFVRFMQDPLEETGATPAP